MTRTSSKPSTCGISMSETTMSGGSLRNMVERIAPVDAEAHLVAVRLEDALLQRPRGDRIVDDQHDLGAVGLALVRAEDDCPSVPNSRFTNAAGLSTRQGAPSSRADDPGPQAPVAVADVDDS